MGKENPEKKSGNGCVAGEKKGARLAPRFENKNARFRVKTQKAICLALRFLKRNILKTLNLSVFGTELMGNYFKTAVF
jgi:hypothetical protein